MEALLSKYSAIVTGASRGIGKEIVKSLLHEGVKVFAVSKSENNLNALCSEFPMYEDRLILVPADLSKTEEIPRLCDLINLQAQNGIDIVINNAGVMPFELLSDLNDEMLSEAFSVNVYAPIKICRYFVPEMIKKQSGRIINICSSSAYTGGGTSHHCVYSATKHALLGFSRALDEEVRKYGIRVGTVSPAGVATDMLLDRADLDASSFMSASEVADAVMYLIKAEGKGIVYELRMWRMNR